MRLSLNELRSIVADIVRDEMHEAIDRAVSRKMGSMAARIVVEAARLAPARPDVGAARPRPAQQLETLRRPTEHRGQLQRPARRETVMENVLRDTAQTTLLAQEDVAEPSELAPPVPNVSDKFERLAFAGNAMPTRSSTVPQLGGDAAAQ